MAFTVGHWQFLMLTMNIKLRKLALLITGISIGLCLMSALRHESFLSNGHSVVFFYPVTLSSENGKDKLEYDFTHEEKVDSITLNFTLISKDHHAVTGLEISGDTINLKPDYFKILYSDYVKGKYNVRVQTSFRYQPFRTLMLFSPDIEFKATVDGQPIIFKYKPSKWKKEQEKMNIILPLFD